MRLGETLAKARLAGERLTEYPNEVPMDLAAAYTEQQAMADAMALPRVGWKVGVTSAAAREMLGLEEPFSGPMYAPYAMPSPAEFRVDANDLRIVEAEIGFRMKNDLVPRAEDYTLKEVSAAIATVHPVFELANKRLPGTAKDDARWLIADGALNQAFIYGAGVAFDSAMDLAAETVRVSVDGTFVTEGVGANALGNPLNVIEWLANHLSARGITLKAGDWVSTGLMCDVVFPDPGATVVAEFGSLGSVTLKLA